MATKIETQINELKINYLTEAQYEEALVNNEINDNEIYMTPSSESGTGEIEEVTLSSLGITATVEELNYVDGVTSNIQTQLNGKASTNHGTHVSFTSTTPKMNGTASVGSASTVSRSDHIHPVDTSRAAASHTHDFDDISGDVPISLLDTEALMALHVWKKFSENPSHTETTETSVVLCSFMGTTNITYAESIEIVDGVVSLYNSITKSTLNFSKDNLKGKYVIKQNTSTIYYIPEDSTIASSNTSAGTSGNYQTTKWTVDTAIKYTSSTAEKLGFVTSETSDTYPTNGSSGSYWYVYIKQLGDVKNYNNATTSSDGLMSAKDKEKLDGLSNSGNTLEYEAVEFTIANSDYLTSIATNNSRYYPSLGMVFVNLIITAKSITAGTNLSGSTRPITFSTTGYYPLIDTTLSCSCGSMTENVRAIVQAGNSSSYGIGLYAVDKVSAYNTLNISGWYIVQ